MRTGLDIAQSTENIIASLSYFVPELIISVGFLLIILIDLFIKRAERLVFIASLVTLLFAAIAYFIQLNIIQTNSLLLFNGMFLHNSYVIGFKLLALFASLLSLIFFNQDRDLKNHPKGINDFFTIFLGGVLGLLTLISSANLLMLFLSIEILSIASYLMVSYTNKEKLQAEAGMKYVLFGATASAIMLYGLTFLYGFSGSLNLYNENIFIAFEHINSFSASLVLLMILAGIGFKLSFVPFHFWTPDAYQQAPTSVSSFLSTVPKIAVFSFLFRLAAPFQLVSIHFSSIILFAAGLTMLVGNVMAVFQKDLKRLLAYSSIGHTGFLLMLLVLPNDSIMSSNLWFYLFAYSITNIGAFMSVAVLDTNFNVKTLEQMKGLGKLNTLIAPCLVIFMVSLTGLPPTVGFIAKFVVFSSLISETTAISFLVPILIVAVLTTVLSLFYYFNIPLHIYLKKPEGLIIKKQKLIFLDFIIVILAIIVLIAGVFPDFFKIF
ncbi:NADH-quinone oxidoreductase subunit N [Pedobacter puniceum]|uniref:NADH-quinone oxidoreductase subunit N n=1 Tax=Pedobacter puniceum TaxID=2666136 RepID=A0A7K0FKF0_9SPHI|nr:NADH-quinone oxidoreductase subunit N [Pedobacter puniceum]MRX45895.1 NADH-quinone oxidoreductase subunit NuoN [Pedobacter puniceum]